MLSLSEEYLIHRKWMRQALRLSQLAGEAGEVPVGAVIIDSSQNMIALCVNRKQRDNDPHRPCGNSRYKRSNAQVTKLAAS